MSEIIGGGTKKILYTLSTVKQIGLKQSAKALTANNTCKACGLGMGGQKGGMTNELGEFPSVCNKSVQAQSTDIQAPIPSEVFNHTLKDFAELSPYEIEHLGRLNTPIFKSEGSDTFTPLSWPQAIELMVNKIRATPPESSFFYASGRASNEAGFLLQAYARCFGTNNVNNCSYYCHQATGVGLQSTIGTATATVELADLKKCDTVFLIGANPSSNHPRFIHQLKALRERGGKVIVINPAKEPGLVKFAVPKSVTSLLKGGNDIASHYLQPKIGSDWYLLAGLAKSVMADQKEDREFISNHSQGFAQYKAMMDEITWQDIEDKTALSQQAIEAIAAVYSQSEKTIFSWGMGITHHIHGSENVEAIANLALLRGMVGKEGAGFLPLRGHSNVQGIGTIGVKPILKPEDQAQLEKLLNIKLPEPPGLDTLNCLKKAEQGKIDLAFIMGGNLLEATPNTQWAIDCLNSIDFRVHLTTTLNRGHILAEKGELLILPVKARDEEDQATTQESMFNFLRMSDGGIERHDSTRSEAAIISDIAEGTLDLEQAQKFEQWRDFKKLRHDISDVVTGLSLLKTIDKNKQEGTIEGRLLHEPTFKLSQQKAQFASSQVKQAERNNKVSQTFTLATIRSEGQFNSIIYEELDSYRYQAPRDALLISEKDIKRLGLRDGQRVDVESASGIFKGMQVKAFDLPPGNVMAYYPEANVLTETSYDPRSKTPNFKSIEVTIVKSGMV